MIAIVRSLDVVVAIAVGGGAAAITGTVILIRSEVERVRELRRRALAYRSTPPVADPDLWGEWGWSE